MKVTFTRTAERRYRVSVEGPVPSWMEPAPGYDARLPHDMAHFVVENELGISGGVFGQLATGGHARTFHPQLSKQGVRLPNEGTELRPLTALTRCCPRGLSISPAEHGITTFLD
jgi:hypothetical protein